MKETMKTRISTWGIKSRGYVLGMKSFLGQALQLTEATRSNAGNVGIIIKLGSLWEVHLASENAGSTKGYPVALPVVIKIPSQKPHINLDLMVHVSTTFISRTTRFGVELHSEPSSKWLVAFRFLQSEPVNEWYTLPILYSTIVKQSSLCTNFILSRDKVRIKRTLNSLPSVWCHYYFSAKILMGLFTLRLIKKLLMLFYSIYVLEYFV